MKTQSNNRISKQNLKDYGMSIITGGKTPVAAIQTSAIAGAPSKLGQPIDGLPGKLVG